MIFSHFELKIFGRVVKPAFYVSGSDYFFEKYAVDEARIDKSLWKK